MKALLLCLAFVLPFTLTAAPTPEAELVLDGDELSPSTTLELRFAREMVTAEMLGVPVTPGPLEVKPELAGKFTWLSKRSGVFVPEREPAMGATYTVSLRAGLKDAGGKPITARWAKKLTTPPFTVVDGLQEGPDQKVQPLPEVNLTFNRQVSLEGAEPLFQFKQGQKTIAARVQYTEPLLLSRNDDERPWELAWGADQRRPAPVPDGQAGEVQKQCVTITPAEPLTPGGLWRLEIAPGVRALVGDLRTAQAQSSELGKVPPFAVEELRLEGTLANGRTVDLQLGRAVHGKLEDEAVSRLFTVTPLVPKFRGEVRGDHVVLHGDFARDVDYSVEISPELRDAAGLPIEGARTHHFRFGPLEPALSLPAMRSHQTALGQKQYILGGVNLKSVHVIAHRVPAEKTAEALKAYAEHREQAIFHEGESPTEPLPPLPGEVVLDRTIPIPEPQLDVRQTIPLDLAELLGGAPSGVLLLELTADALAQPPREPLKELSLLQCTELGVLWQQTAKALGVSVFSLKTGQPVPDAEITLQEEENKNLGSARTDASGAVTLPKVLNVAWLTARRGGDSYTMQVGVYGSELPGGDSDNMAGRSGATHCLLFSDRPLYRPGETVHLKGLLRTFGAKGVGYAAGEKVTLTVQKPNNAGEQEIHLEADAHGAFHTELQLDAASVGQYSLRLSGEESGADLGFTDFVVAEFQPSAFEVAVTFPERIGPAEPVEARITGRYFFGALLARAHVQWSLAWRSARFSSPAFAQFTFGHEDEEVEEPPTLRGSGELPSEGTLAVRPRVPAPNGHLQEGELTVEITDENQQTISRQQEFHRDASSFYLGVKLSPAQPAPNEPVTAAVIAVKPDGTPVEHALQVKAELVRVHPTWGPADAHGLARLSIKEEVQGSVAGRTLVPTRGGAAWIVPAGETARFTPKEPGSYVLRVSTTDEAGRPVVTDSLFRVGESSPEEKRDARSALEMQPDQPDYHPGQTAHLQLHNAQAGELKVTIERDGEVLRTLTQRVPDGDAVLDVPILEGDLPNIYVSALSWRGAVGDSNGGEPDYRYGRCRLLVREPASALKVEIATPQAKAEPGQEITAEITVLEADGKPSAGADVTFYAVDNGVLALTEYTRPEPLSFFEQPLTWGIRTGLSLREAEERNSTEFAKEMVVGMSPPGADSGPRPRSRFQATACWEPALITDERGRVTVKFKAPDALTSYRLVAVVAAGPNRFGSAESAVEVSKRLSLLSGLGQAGRVGDTLLARAVVRNDSAAAGEVAIALELDATAEALNQPLQTTLMLQAGESRSVDIPVRLRATGTAAWKWTAQMRAGTEQLYDGLVVSLAVNSPAPLLRETYLPELRGAQNDLLTRVNPQLLEGTGQVQVTLSNTRLSSLRECTEALLEYPYGCAEQTLSTMIPWIVGPEFGRVLPALGDRKAAEEAIARGLNRLRTMLVSGGEANGIAYWPGDRHPSLFATAYTAIVLSLRGPKDAAGASAPFDLQSSLEEALQHIDDPTARAPREDYVWAVYALACLGQPSAEDEEKLYAQRAKLTAESRALLACAMLEHEGFSGAKVEKLLDPRAAGAKETMDWFSSPTRARSIRLLAWTRFRPKDREVARLTQELLAARVKGRWRTTQENAWALLALWRYYQAMEGEPKAVSGTLAQDGENKAFTLTPETMSMRQEVNFTPARGLGSMTVANPQKAPLYGDVRFTVQPPVARQPRQNRGYNVVRTYQKLGPDGALEEAKDLAVGDRLVVTLRVESAAPGHFVAIDDPLPAVLEAVNPDLAAQAVGGAARVETDWASDYREVRADRVVYFADHLPAGPHTFRYLARVRTAGEAIAPSTKVEEMYRPERFGLGEASTVTARPR